MTDENMFPCSVRAIRGISSSTALSSRSSMRQAPSSSEYSECRWRWTKALIADCRLQIADSRSDDCRLPIVRLPFGAGAPIDHPQSSIRQSAICNLQSSMLFPLNRRRRLGTDVVHDAIDSTDLVDDTRRNSLEQLVREARPVGGHAVAALDGTDRGGVLVGPRVAHDADALHRQSGGKPPPPMPAPTPPLH